MKDTAYYSPRLKELTPYTAGFQPTGETIKLNTNENPYPPSKRVREVMELFDCSKLRLYPRTDGGEGRIAAAQLNGVGVENIFCANGSDEAIALAFYAFFEDTLLMPKVTYSFYPVWSKLYGITYQTTPMNEDGSICVPALLNSSGGVVLANPNAPTGKALGLDDLEVILANNSKVVLIDEAYVGFGCDSALPLLKKYDNLLISRTLSKTHALAGLRFGYMIGSEGLIEGLTTVRDSFNSYPTDMLSQEIAAAALKDYTYYEDIAQKIIEARDFAANALGKLGFDVMDSKANFLFAKPKNSSAKDVYESLCKHNIYVRHFNSEMTKDYLRITIGTMEQMCTLVDTLKTIVR